jgi:hypothetical protein
MHAAWPGAAIRLILAMRTARNVPTIHFIDGGNAGSFIKITEV